MASDQLKHMPVSHTESFALLATLIIQDWGGAFGFDYAIRHRDNVKAIAFFEAVAFTFTWEAFPPAFRETFKAFRTPGVGWKLIGEDNFFVDPRRGRSSVERRGDEPVPHAVSYDRVAQAGMGHA